jgi:peptidoglycan hydrolase-like protein with peptidoglycan-binding domain
MTSRKRLFLAVVAVAVAFGAGGYVLGQQLESPEDARSEVAAPEPSLIAVPVEATALSNDVVVRGDAEFEGAVDLELDSALGDGTARVVTGRVPEIDTEVNEGDVIIEVSGRPVFVLGGDLPTFREFKPGLEGDDVLQLETSLARLGFLTVDPDRLYGSATEDAIMAMYEEAGYEPRAASDGEEAQIKSAEQAVETARTALANANDGLSDLLRPPSLVEQTREAQTRQQFLDQIERSQEALDEAIADRPSNPLLQAIDGLQQAENAGEGVAQANQAVMSAQDAEQARVDAAQEQLDNATQSLIDADAITAAEDSDGVDTSDAQQSVTDAQERLDEVEGELGELEEDIGVRFPVAEVVFLPNLPRTVTSIDVERGDFVNGAVMRISGTKVRITTGVSESNRPLLEVGQRVIIDSEQLDIEVEGEITELADRKGTNGVADTRYYMLVTPVGEYNVSELVGVNFRLQIPLERSEGDVLAVPLAALSAGADGSSRVEVERADGTTDLVLIEVGLQDKNRSLVEVIPIGGNLSAGDLVVIGIEQPAAAAAVSGDGPGEEAGS